MAGGNAEFAQISSVNPALHEPALTDARIWYREGRGDCELAGRRRHSRSGS